ncbi:MAG: N-acetylmuramoyl-L-alanine amidase, partial [Coleofasciculus sp. Co-bin14]|nr:N-acetylmuramoyl-L-alanine amidase [Coleofasciculus sp. Co-bin14]
NALPDDGDAIKTKGVSTFWYHAQAHSLAVYLHNHLVKTLNRPSYGVFWNNLALTRPSGTPSVLLELGFMINPDEYEGHWYVLVQHPGSQFSYVFAQLSGAKVRASFLWCVLEQSGADSSSHDSIGIVGTGFYD